MTDTATANPALRRLKRVALYVLLAAIIIAAWGIFTRVQTRAALKQDAQQSAVPAVIVTTPKHSDVSDELVLPGDVQAYTDAPIYARTSGYLKRWYADIGQHVKAGELLAEIETPEVDAQYRQAKADLATVEANNRLSQTTAQRFQDLKKTGLVWNEANLTKWVAGPQRVAPGTKMAFPGLSSKKQQADVVAYLATLK